MATKKKNIEELDNFGGFDLGNRYGKIESAVGDDELIVCYRYITEEEYNNMEVGEDAEKVLYEGEYILLGATGTKSIIDDNKGSEKVKTISNAFKLTMLAREMRKRETDKMTYKLVTGTPPSHYEGNKEDYENLFRTEGEEYEEIEVGGEKFEIRVEDVEVRKQSSEVIYTIKDWKKGEFCVWDWGSGTLDITIYSQGTRGKSVTVPFSLNKLYMELGHYLYKFLGEIEVKPNDANYIKSMENLKFNGDYNKVTTVTTKEGTVALKDIVSSWFQERVNDAIDDGLYMVGVKKSELNIINNVHVGGGAKLLENEISNNEKLLHSSITEKPEGRNALAYYKIAKALRKWRVE